MRDSERETGPLNCSYSLNCFSEVVHFAIGTLAIQYGCIMCLIEQNLQLLLYNLYDFALKNNWVVVIGLQ